MSEQNPANSVLSSLDDEDKLNFTQTIRKDLIGQLIDKGIPEDKADKSLLVSLLDGMDRTVLTKARIKADTKNTDNQSQVVNLIASLLNQVNPNKIKSYDEHRVIPELPNDLVLPDYIEGENTEGIVNSNYESFMTKFPKEE